NSDDWSRIATLRIAGGGPLAERVEGDVLRLKAQGRPVELHGYLGKQEAAALLDWADYLLIPSRIESIPVVLSDALQSGCPVVASPVGDLPLIVSSYRMGLLAPGATVPGLQLAIRTALHSSAAAFQAGMVEGRAAFDVEKIADRLLVSLSLSTHRSV